MPSILSNITGEKITLTRNEKSPYKPPELLPGDSDSCSSTVATEQPTYGVVDGQRRKDDVVATGRVPPNGILNELKLPGEPMMNNTRDSVGTGGSPLGKSDNPTVNGSNRPSQESNDHHNIPDGLPDSLPSSTSAEQQKRDMAQQRGSFEKSQATKVWQNGHGRHHSSSAPQNVNPHVLNSIGVPPPATESTQPTSLNADQRTNKAVHLVPTAGSSTSSLHPTTPRLVHRHTLEVPRLSTSRTSRDFTSPQGATDAASESDRLTPTHRTPRASNTIARAPSRSIHSDMYLDEIPADSDMAKWTETVRQKRASRRKRKEEEDDRVIVGTKVDVNHVNWVTAYNMLTGIRFTVSRTHAKIDRDLTDADFDARHKFSFDITGNELTPSAKYDFKFKDYAPWVFRHLRARFRIDPADYLISLTSKYILSELGSPGKSGSFFYFSRDYKYIIKTIHHAEQKLLRSILREYYAHVERHPNTLISQFYGLHRVKIPYGPKIHFVVMNNLFPPHRDIHQTFDLKGSTIGRDFKEDDLEHNPRATLKDLNWLRRNYHFNFGPQKKTLFVEQIKRDVALLRKLKIMDYSLLVGIHDLTRGNEENLRDKTLRIFEPGGDDDGEPQAKMLTRTPSKLKNVRQAKQLRQIIKNEKPVPMDKSTSKMPEELLDERKNFIFYSDDGGFRATHEDGQPGEEIYYLGIIDCLTHYGFVKRVEHLWKGMSANKSQISPIPPDDYGDRFVKFIGGLTKTKEEVEREEHAADQLDGSATPSHRQPSWSVSRKSTDKIIAKAEKQAEKSDKEGANEEPVRDRTIGTARSSSTERSGGGVAGATLPVVQEDTEGSREASIHDEKSQARPPNAAQQDNNIASKASRTENNMLPNIPLLQRLSLGLSSKKKRTQV